VRLASLRSYARFVVFALLVTAPSVFAHTGQDDFACALAGAADAAPWVDEAVPDAPQHCLICHWTHALRYNLAASEEVVTVLVAADEIDTPAAVAQRAPALDRLPARAPPAFA
jgi:hypothetical protein